MSEPEQIIGQVLMREFRDGQNRRRVREISAALAQAGWKFVRESSIGETPET